MSLWEALLLGLVQGVTEFLPVSSSGHLVLGELLLGVTPNLAFNAALHGGTLVVVVGYYRRDLLDMFRDSWTSLRGLFGGRRPAAIWAEDHGTRLALLISAGSVPTAVLGLALRAPIERAFHSGVLTSVALLVTGALLLTTRCSQTALEPEPSPLTGPTAISLPVALLVGVAQGLAIFPGISRSGATLVAALLLGAGRADAARFCFLLSVPAILGALVLESGELAKLGALGPGSLALGIGVAMVAGYLSLSLLVGLVRRGGLHRFAYYVIPVGLAGILYFSLR
jgi:undecaprenyl-diphosphatase